jgi:phosphoglycerate kinase
MSYRLLSSASLSQKRVLLRAGFDLPIENGVVTDSTRVHALEKTMRCILDQGGILILLAHQGRPKDGPDPEYSQRPLVPVLEALLHTTVHFTEDCIGESAERVIATAKPGEVVLLENLRFHPEEKKNDPAFASALAALGDVYVNDAFTNCHRDHASMVTLPTLLPSYMGFSLAEEVKYLHMAIENPPHPLTLIVAGSKMETKVPVIESFLSKGDTILVGGCIANTFIAAEHYDVACSKFDPVELPVAEKLLETSHIHGNARIIVPSDVVVAPTLSAESISQCVSVDEIPSDTSIFDVGPSTIEEYCSLISSSSLIIWNGPVGVYEHAQFSAASIRIAQAIALATKNGAVSIIGGGDTIDFHLQYDLPLSAYSFVSMGGGAMLEYIAGKPFRSLEVLQD